MVSPLVVDRDEGVPGGQLGVRGDAGEVDALGAQQGEGLVRGRVGAHRGDQRDLRAEPPGGERLVGPLAAGHPAQLVGGERLAGLGQPRHARDQIEVDAPDDDDASHGRGP